MTTQPDLFATGEHVVRRARALGADEVTARLASGTTTELEQREGKLEKLQESRSVSLRVAVLVDDRWSVHVTNDLQPDSLEPFLSKAIDATRFLEADANRRLPPATELGTADASALDLGDPTWADRNSAERRIATEQLERVVLAATTDVPLRSATVGIWDGHTHRAMVTSNGFGARWSSTSFGQIAVMTLEDAGGRLPEAYAYHSTHHLSDLPSADVIASDVVDRARRRLGSGPTTSGRYPMLLENRTVSRLISVLLDTLDGATLNEQRSCMADRMDKRIASTAFTLIDDPLIPRGLGSFPYDGDGLPARRRDIVRDGVLRTFFLDVYYARRLGLPPTSGSIGNLVVPAGARSPAAIAADHARAIRVESFLGGNSNPTSGDFSFGIQGTLMERGEPVAAVSEMNISGNLFELLESFVEAADDPWVFGSTRSPTLLFDQVQFSGT